MAGAMREGPVRTLNRSNLTRGSHHEIRVPPPSPRFQSRLNGYPQGPILRLRKSSQRAFFGPKIAKDFDRLSPDLDSYFSGPQLSHHPRALRLLERRWLPAVHLRTRFRRVMRRAAALEVDRVEPQVRPVPQRDDMIHLGRSSEEAVVTALGAECIWEPAAATIAARPDGAVPTRRTAST
jgi:hypothetical protein